MRSPDLDALFPHLGQTVYMNTASLGVGCKAAVDALACAANAWGEGRLDFVEAERAGEEVRCLFARTINVEPDCVALIPTASGVAGQVAAYLRCLPVGSNILVGEQEYTSALFAWLQLRAIGFEVRLIPFQNGMVSVDAFAAAADAHTRLIAVSAIQSATGYRIDLAALRDIANRSKAMLYVDAAQAAGAGALDAGALELDVVAAPSHKFLLGTRGMGYAYFRRPLRDAMQPVAPGWKAASEPFTSFYGPDMHLSATASRFDQSLAWINALAEREALRVLTMIGMGEIEQMNSDLIGHMRAALDRRRLDYLDFGPDRSSTIFSIKPSTENAELRLREGGVVAASRAGRVRLSLHFYNTMDQIDYALSLLSRT